MKTIKTFTFLDESGSLAPVTREESNVYGVGFIKHTNPNVLIARIHPIFESLCSVLKKDETRVEFSFKLTTAKSNKFDLVILDALLNDFDWEFNCLYFTTVDKNYKQPLSPVERWERYVEYTKMLIRNNLWSNEETIVIADYQRKPKDSRKKFEFIAIDIPQVYNVLQVESQGVLLIQLTDLLLGGFLYSLKENVGDKERNKVRIMEKVLKIKNKVGKKKFNAWKVDWSKSCRGERV